MPSGRAAQWAEEEASRGGAAESDKESHFQHATPARIRLKDRRIMGGRQAEFSALLGWFSQACLAALSKETALSICFIHTIITSVSISTSIPYSQSSHASFCLSSACVYLLPFFPLFMICTTGKYLAIEAQDFDCLKLKVQFPTGQYCILSSQCGFSSLPFSQAGLLTKDLKKKNFKKSQLYLLCINPKDLGEQAWGEGEVKLDLLWSPIFCVIVQASTHVPVVVQLLLKWSKVPPSCTPTHIPSLGIKTVEA